MALLEQSRALAVLLMVALQAEMSLRAQVRGTAGLSINTLRASPRTEAHWTRRSSEAARGVLSRIIKKEISYCFHCFGRTACLN